MKEGLAWLLIITGVPLCCAAGLAAFLITYEAYLKGEKPDKKLALRQATQMALIALLFFTLIISGIIWFLLNITRFI